MDHVDDEPRAGPYIRAKVSTGKRVLMLVFVYIPIAIFVLIPCYTIGAVLSVFWNALCTGWQMGDKWLQARCDELVDYRP